MPPQFDLVTHLYFHIIEGVREEFKASEEQCSHSCRYHLSARHQIYTHSYFCQKIDPRIYIINAHMGFYWKRRRSYTNKINNDPSGVVKILRTPGSLSNTMGLLVKCWLFHAWYAQRL